MNCVSFILRKLKICQHLLANVNLLARSCWLFAYSVCELCVNTVYSHLFSSGVHTNCTYTVVWHHDVTVSSKWWQETYAYLLRSLSFMGDLYGTILFKGVSLFFPCYSFLPLFSLLQLVGTHSYFQLGAWYHSTEEEDKWQNIMVM